MQTVAPLSVIREPIAETSGGYGGTIDHICMPAIATVGEISNSPQFTVTKICMSYALKIGRAIWS